LYRGGLIGKEIMRHVKPFIAAVVIAAALIPALARDASAWTCYARSPTGSWGWGSNYSQGAAQRRALNECAVRTPRGYVCRITGCR
jgi:hypothetical protein